jgi:trehalose 6-phosphate synthase
MMEKLRAGTIQRWFADFVEALQESQGDGCAPEPPAVWPLRSVNSAGHY